MGRNIGGTSRNPAVSGKRKTEPGQLLNVNFDTSPPASGGGGAAPVSSHPHRRCLYHPSPPFQWQPLCPGVCGPPASGGCGAASVDSRPTLLRHHLVPSSTSATLPPALATSLIRSTTTLRQALMGSGVAVVDKGSCGGRCKSGNDGSQSGRFTLQSHTASPPPFHLQWCQAGTLDNPTHVYVMEQRGHVPETRRVGGSRRRSQDRCQM